jgi:hypothetical protein
LLFPSFLSQLESMDFLQTELPVRDYCSSSAIIIEVV